MASKRKKDGKTLAEIFSNESAIDKLTLADFDSIHLENCEDTVTVKVLLPVEDGSFAEYEETLDLDDKVDSQLHMAARNFSVQLLRAMKERSSKNREIPCTTCMGACCYKYEEVRLTKQDVDMLTTALGSSKVQESVHFYTSGERWTGYIGAFKKTTRKISGKTIDTACVFLRDNGCSIYENRPKVCREYSPWTCDDTYEADPKKVDGKVRLRVI